MSTDSRNRVEAFFRRRSDVPDTVVVTDYQPITGGYSRTMARVWVEDRCGRHGFVVRSDPPPGQSIILSDRAEEWATLSALAATGAVPIPRPRWFDPTGEELGSPTIVMDLVEGESLLSLVRGCDPRDFPRLRERLCRVISAIHTSDIGALPQHLAIPGSWDGYIDTRIQRWIDGEQAHVEADPFMRTIAGWLDSNRPAPAPLCLVHGDFQTANVLVEPARRFLVTDWELAHIGDPREDLGWWALNGVTQPPDLIATDEEDFYAGYRDLTGLTQEQLNPATVAYFTVLASDAVFVSVLEQLASLARGETTSTMIAYMSHGVTAMHNIFIQAMARHDALTGGGR